jgi:magnesium transporter
VITLYQVDKTQLVQIGGGLSPDSLAAAHWIDLSNVSADEKRQIESALAVDLTPVNDYEPYQVSTHFSATERQLTMTGLLLTMHSDGAKLLKVTFIRAHGKLITISSGDGGLAALTKECESVSAKQPGGDDVFAAVLDMIVDHTDNILDAIGHDLETINGQVFQYRQSPQRRRLLLSSPRRRNRQLEGILTALGPKRDALVKLRRSVLSFRRMVAFLRGQQDAAPLLSKLKAFERNLQSIEEAESDLSATAGFLLDGVIGYIDLLQNKVMTVLTFITLILTPAMVVGAIYGMNFKIMPELQWTYGYPYALGLIVLSTLALYIWVRARGL